MQTAKFSGSELEIDVSNPDWCQYRLRQGKKVTDLGAESMKYIKGHLLDGLGEGRMNLGRTYNGHDVF
jgi:hypothetical protein